MDRARRSMEEELYRKLDEHGAKKIIFKMAQARTDRGWKGRGERCCDQGLDNNGRLIITEIKEVLRIWAVYFKELLNGK